MRIANILAFAILIQQARGNQSKGLRGLQQVQTQPPEDSQVQLRKCISTYQSSYNDRDAQCSGKREICDQENPDFNPPAYNDNISLEAILNSQTNCIEKERQCKLESLNEFKDNRIECADKFSNNRDDLIAQQCTSVAFEIEQVESEVCLDKYKVCEKHLLQYLQQSSENILYSSINADRLCQEQFNSCKRDINDLRNFFIKDCNSEPYGSQDTSTPEPTYSPYQENTQDSSNDSNGFLTEGIDNWMIYALGFSVAISCLTCLICCEKNSKENSQGNSPICDDDSRSNSSRSNSGRGDSF